MDRNICHLNTAVLFSMVDRNSLIVKYTIYSLKHNYMLKRLPGTIHGDYYEDIKKCYSLFPITEIKLMLNLKLKIPAVSQ